MDIAPFEQLVNQQGLVLMMITMDYAPYYQGSLAGFLPADAERLFSLNAAVPVDENHQPIFVKEEPVEREVIEDAVFTVEIPDNWEALHHLQRIRLAKSLQPLVGGITSVEADDIIKAELIRRESQNGDHEV